MSIQTDHRKYKRLVKELLYVYSEKEYMDDILSDANTEFEKACGQYCEENQVVRKDKAKQEEQIRAQMEATTELQEDDMEREPLSLPKPPREDEGYKTFNRIYRLIAKKIHPDKFESVEKTDEIREKIIMFKQASTAFSRQNWASLLEIADKLNINPISYKGISRRIRDEISDIKKYIVAKERTYGWKFYECDEDEDCQRELVAKFINQVNAEN